MVWGCENASFCAQFGVFVGAFGVCACVNVEFRRAGDNGNAVWDRFLP